MSVVEVIYQSLKMCGSGRLIKGMRRQNVLFKGANQLRTPTSYTVPKRQVRLQLNATTSRQHSSPLSQCSQRCTDLCFPDTAEIQSEKEKTFLIVILHEIVFFTEKVLKSLETNWEIAYW